MAAVQGMSKTTFLNSDQRWLKCLSVLASLFELVFGQHMAVRFWTGNGIRRLLVWVLVQTGIDLPTDSNCLVSGRSNPSQKMNPSLISFALWGGGDLSWVCIFIFRMKRFGDLHWKSHIANFARAWTLESFATVFWLFVKQRGLKWFSLWPHRRLSEGL